MKVRWQQPSMLMAILLCACSPDQEIPKSTASSAEGKNTVWKNQINALDKAKGVESLVDDAAQRQRKVLLDSGG